MRTGTGRPGEGNLAVEARRALRLGGLTDRVQRIEDTEGDLRAAQVRRRVVDLREPVRVDVAQADQPRVVLAGEPVAEAARAADARERHVVRITSCWNRPMLRPKSERTHVACCRRSGRPGECRGRRCRGPYCGTAPLASCRFGLPPSLVLCPDTGRRFAAMSMPFCVVETPNTKAAGRRPLLTDEAVELPSIRGAGEAAGDHHRVRFAA